MWLFTDMGFVSIVEDRAHPGNLLVRGRLKGDVEAMFPTAKGKVKVTPPPRDYRFRASMPRVEVGARLAELASLISYDNFKNSTPKARHGFLLRIWNIMMDAQERALPLKRKSKYRAQDFDRLWVGNAVADEPWADHRSYGNDPDAYLGLPLIGKRIS